MDLRNSLQGDYEEMQKAAKVGAWKSAQVMAGSIVECLLVDYLLSKPDGPPGKNPLKMDLAEAIAACKEDGAISDRTADLCAVVRSYRNLIHPGRMIRLEEKAPNRASGEIAVALIELIVDDIAQTRRDTVGLTAEQILQKIEKDFQIQSILRHLLDEVREAQRVRLLTDLLPKAHRAHLGYFEGQEVAKRIEAAFRTIFESLSASRKTEVADRFARLLREEDGEVIATYRMAFFKGSDLEHLSPQHLAIVKEHIFGSIGNLLRDEDLAVLAGIGKFLVPEDARRWFGPIMLSILSPSIEQQLKKKARIIAIETIAQSDYAFWQAADRVAASWIKAYEERGKSDTVDLIQGFRSDLDDSIPF